MCENCAALGAPIRPSAALIARTRAVEASLPGERVADAAFAVFFGERGGSIPWPQYQRLRQAFETAAASLTRRPVGSFRCEVA